MIRFIPLSHHKFTHLVCINIGEILSAVYIVVSDTSYQFCAVFLESSKTFRLLFEVSDFWCAPLLLMSDRYLTGTGEVCYVCFCVCGWGRHWVVIILTKWQFFDIFCFSWIPREMRKWATLLLGGCWIRQVKQIIQLYCIEVV